MLTDDAAEEAGFPVEYGVPVGVWVTSSEGCALPEAVTELLRLALTDDDVSVPLPVDVSVPVTDVVWDGVPDHDDVCVGVTVTLVDGV
jgi:hypothetical protein